MFTTRGSAVQFPHRKKSYFLLNICFSTIIVRYFNHSVLTMYVRLHNAAQPVLRSSGGHLYGGRLSKPGTRYVQDAVSF